MSPFDPSASPTSPIPGAPQPLPSVVASPSRRLSEAFQWQEGDYNDENEPSLDISECMWAGATHEEDLSYILEDTTPAKDCCGGAPYHLGNFGEMSKVSDGCRVTSSQVKRRRVLQFNNEDLDLTFQSDSSAFLKSKENIDAIDEALDEASQREAKFQEDSHSSGLECLDECEDWLADCLNYPEMHDSATDMNCSGVNDDVLIDVSEFCDPPPPPTVTSTVQQRTVRTSRNIIFKGRKSYMQTPIKLGSSVAYPFTFIKPSGVNGDVTLEEINQRLKAPPPLKPKEDDTVTYGTSAYSGKPVVNKTKIRTEGGKGSITIMRTKG